MADRNTEQDYENYFRELELNHQDLLDIKLRLMKLQNNIYERYFSNSDVIKLNYLEYMRKETRKLSSKEELKEWLEAEIKRMKSVGREFTHIERIEYRLVRKIYKDVINGDGERATWVDGIKALEIDYDGEKIQFDPITFDIEPKYEQ